MTREGSFTVDRLTLRDRVLERLRQAILEVELPPGTRLTEVELGEKLGVSRGTVREALLRLSDEQLVINRARVGTVVRGLGPEEVRDIYAVRAELEGLAVRLASKRPAEEVRAVLGPCLDRMAASKKQPFFEQLAADVAFHEAICRLSGNDWLLATWRLLSGPIRAALASAGPDLVQPYQTLEHHSSVADAIIGGDSEGAASLLIGHLALSARDQSEGMLRAEKSVSHEEGAAARR